MITTTYNQTVEEGEISTHGEFVFTFGNITIKIDYSLEDGKWIFTADVKYSFESFSQKLDQLLEPNGKLSLTTMNGGLWFKNNGNGEVSINLFSSHSYHGFSTEVKYDLNKFVEEFKNCLNELEQKSK